MKYRAKVNVVGANPETGGAVEYKQGSEYEEKEIVPGMDMGDFEPVDRTDAVETSDSDEDAGEKEVPNLNKMNRKQLDEYTLEHTNLDPDAYSTKDELIAAIEDEA